MLRLGLVENIRRLALRVIHRVEEVESADHWAERLQEASRLSPKALTDALSAFVDGHPPLTPVFVSRLFQQIRGYQAEFRKLLWLEQWIAEEALTAEDAVTRSNQRLALTQVMMANHLTSLRRISRLDWDAFFEAQSETEAILRRDPAGFYARMTFQTRDRYRHVVEDVARGADGAEAVVARRAIELAQAHAAGGREAHVGYYLIDVGRGVLEAAVGYRAGFRERLYRLSHRHANLTYFGAALLVGAALVAAFLLAVHRAPPWVQGVLLVLAFVPISELAIGTVNQLLTLLLPPGHLPKLEFREGGITPDFRTIVAVPTLLPSVRVVREQLAHLEVQYLANRQSNLHFALLSDFTDATAEHAPGDEDIRRRRGRRHSRPQRDLRRGPRAHLLSSAPSPAVEPPAGRVDGLGAEARQAGTAQRAHPNRGPRAVLHCRGRSGPAPRRPLRHHARLRHDAAA